MKRTRPGARGQPVQIGVLLLFAFLIIGLGLFQAVLVPQENGQVEFNHNERVQSDMVDLRSQLLRTAATGERRTSRVELGTTYPARTLLLNPAPPSGTLRTTYRGNFSVANAEGIRSDVDDYWDGNERSYRTRSLVYDPGYNVYDDAPETVFEGSVLYNRFDADTLALSNQTFISSRTISLTALQGDYGESSPRTVPVDPRVISSPNRSVTVTDDGDPVTLRVPTRLSESTWQRLLSAEIGPGNDQHVEQVRVVEGPSGPDDVLVVELEQGVNYNLRLGAVGVGSRGSTERREQDPEYLVVTGGDGNSIDEGDQQRLAVEVRDRYNNPVAGETVTFRQPAPGYLAGAGGPTANVTVTTDQSGRAAVTYAAPRNVPDDRTVTFAATVGGGDPGAPSDRRTAELTVTVEDNAEAAADTDYGRPLLSAIEPTPGEGGTSATAEFVRVWFPVNGEYTLRESDGTGSKTVTVSSAPTEYYFVAGGGFDADGPCGGAGGQRTDLGGIDLADTGETVRVVRTSDGLVRDSLTYDDDAASDNATFVDAQAGVQITEDGAYVDTNVSAVDWTSDRASEVCGVDETPTVGALSASSNLSRTDTTTTGSPPSTVVETFTDEIAVTYNVSDDGRVSSINATVEDAGDGTNLDTERPSAVAGSVRLGFGERQLASDPVTVIVTVTDDAGQERTCEGTLGEAGATLTRADGGLTCSP